MKVRKKIIAFAASNSSKSINKQLAHYTASMVKDSDVELLELNDFKLPIYSEDIEADSGIPEAAQQFLDKLQSADAFIISLAEHNGYYTSFYKNLLDWVSRITPNVFQNKPVLYLSTSPGPNGAATVLQHAIDSAPFIGAELAGHFSLPSFHDNFDRQDSFISDPALQQDLSSQIAKLSNY